MTNTIKSGGLVGLGAMALGLMMVACGGNQVDGSAVTGVAQSDAPVAGTVSLADSSGLPQQRQVTTRSDGSFSVDVTGLTPPYMLRVAFTEGVEAKRLYAVTEGNENLDVNPISDVAFSGASEGRDEEDLFQHSSGPEKRDTVTRARGLLATLRTVLAPLFERYAITSVWTDKAAVRALLADVGVVKAGGVVTVTNKATGAVIFSGALADLAAGTFSPENMPAGPGTTPPTSTCTYTYGAWGACQSSNSQTRTLASTTPAGCTGSPVLGQACNYLPPASACTSFTYSAYGTCQSSNTQTRTVLTSSPASCTGGSPITSQACTYVPPAPATCTSFTYSAYGTCQSSNTQTRTVLTSSPASCTGGSPITSQACTYTTPIDGAALYTQYCSSCHGTSKKGASASSIQSAITSNLGGMGSTSLKALTSAQIQAISAAP
jgi:hypothetical protein